MEFKLNFKEILHITATIDRADIALISIAIVPSILGITLLRMIL